MTAWSTAVTVNQLVTATIGQLGPRVLAMAGGCSARQDDAATTLASRGWWKGFSFSVKTRYALHLQEETSQRMSWWG